MAAITRLQVIDLRDKGVITPERAADWLSILSRGGVLDVSQQMVDQAATTASLLPTGVTVTGDKEIEIDFGAITREGILTLRSSETISSEQAVEFLQKQREAESRPDSIGGKLLDAFRFAFDPTDPRGTVQVGPVPIKTGLAAAGLGLALPAAAVTAAPGLAVTSPAGVLPTAVPAIAGAVGRAPGAVATTAARLTGVAPRSIPRLAGTAAVGTGTGLAVSAALSGDTAPPPEITGDETVQGQQTDVAAMVNAITQDTLAQGGTADDAAAEVQKLGVDVQYITRKVKRFNPGTGQIEEVDSIIPIITEQVPDGLGGFITQSTAGAPFFPELAQGQFELQQAEQQRTEFIDSLPSLTQFFAQLADPKTANLLRISSARAGGQPTVSGLNLPEQLGALFGLRQGEELPSGVAGGGDDVTSGFLSGINTLLGQQAPITGPGLQAQITPGAAQGLNPEGLGALQAALIGSGTTLEEERRKARTSALPGRR